MNRLLTQETQTQDPSLILFVTGEAPRSRRAQSNLATTLEASYPAIPAFQVIDLLREPQQAIRFGIFATPALMHIDASGQRRVLYGDLSDAHSLMAFISAL